MSLPPFFLLAFFLFLLTKKFKKPTTHRKLPPGPWKLPIIGSIHHLNDPVAHRAFAQLSRKFGPVMHLQVGEVPMVVISSAQLAKEALKTHDSAFANRPEVLLGKILSYDYTDLAFTPYSPYWRQIHKISMLELLNQKMVKSFYPIREEESSRLIESIHSSLGEPTNLSKKLHFYTNAVVCRAAAGSDMKVRSQAALLIPLLQEVVSLSGRLDVYDMFPSLRFLQNISGNKSRLSIICNTVDQILQSIIDEHVKKGVSNDDRKDLIDTLLTIKEIGGLEFPITYNHIKALIVNIFAGAAETSAGTIDWAMVELLRAPRVMKKAQAEVRKAFQGKNEIYENDLQDLKYLKLVIKETLRLHPALPLIPRQCREECTFNGYTIPVKTRVWVNCWAIGRDPRYWHDANKFIPERFEHNSFEYIGTRFEYIPFGSGTRMCPGISFATQILELPLAKLLYHFNWKLAYGMVAEKLDMMETVGLSALRRNDLHIIASPTDS